MDEEVKIWLADEGIGSAISGAVDLTGDRPIASASGELTPFFDIIPAADTEGDQELHPRPFGPDHESHLVHARITGDVALTIARAYTSYREGDGSRQDLKGEWAVTGGHVTEATAYAAARIKIRNLDRWREGFIHLDPMTRQPTPVLSDRAEIPVPAPALGPRAELSLELATSGEEAAETYWIVAQHLPRLELDQILGQFAKPVSQLVTIACNSRSPMVEVQLMEHTQGKRNGEPASGAPWLQLHHHPLLDRTASEPRPPYDNRVVHYSDVGLAGFATWLSNVPALDVIPTLIAKQVPQPPTSLENQLLVLASAAEGFHRRFKRKSKRLSQEQVDSVATMVAASNELDDKTRDVLQQHLLGLGDASFKERLVDLAATTSDAVPGATGNSEVWARRVRDHRNRFAHNLPKGRPPEFYEMLTLWRSLRWVLRALMLEQAGVRAETMALRLRRNIAWNTFTMDAPRYAPAIYLDPADPAPVSV